MTADEAVSLGPIANELVTDACTHARRSGARARRLLAPPRQPQRRAVRSGVRRALRLDASSRDPSAPHALMLARVPGRLRDFGVAQFYPDHLCPPLIRAQAADAGGSAMGHAPAVCDRPVRPCGSAFGRSLM